MSNSTYIKIDNADEFVNSTEIGDLAAVHSALRLQIIIPLGAVEKELILVAVTGPNGISSFVHELTAEEVDIGEIFVFIPIANVSANGIFVDGDYQLTLTKSNDAGASTDYPGIATFTLDTIAPDAPQVALNNDSGSSNVDLITDTAQITVTSSESNSQIEYSNDNGVTWSQVQPDATEGPNTLLVREVDLAGNPSNATTFNFTLDTIAAQVDIDNIDLTNDKTPAITGTVDDVNATVVISIVGVDYPAVNNGDGTWVVEENVINELAEGANSITVKVTDLAGNESTGAGSVFLDSLAPEFHDQSLEYIENQAAGALIATVEATDNIKVNEFKFKHQDNSLH